MKSHDAAAKHEKTTANIVHPSVKRPQHCLNLEDAIVVLGNRISLIFAEFCQRGDEFIIDEDDECWAGEQLWKLHMRVTSIRAELASLRGKVRVGLFL
jgi:hypothetical protein